MPSFDFDAAIRDPGRIVHASEGQKCQSCPIVGSKSQRLLMCSGCKLAWYCSPKCQKEAWKNGHKAFCKDYQSRRQQLGSEEVIKWHDILKAWSARNQIPLETAANCALLPHLKQPTCLIDTHILVVELMPSENNELKVNCATVEPIDVLRQWMDTANGSGSFDAYLADDIQSRSPDDAGTIWVFSRIGKTALGVLKPRSVSKKMVEARRAAEQEREDWEMWLKGTAMTSKTQLRFSETAKQYLFVQSPGHLQETFFKDMAGAM